MKSVARRGHKKAGSTNTGAVVNRRATYDYQLSDRLTVGLSLTGMETKAARLGHVSLRGAYVVPKRNVKTGRDELFLINASFTLNNNTPKGSGQSRTMIDTGSQLQLDIPPMRQKLQRYDSQTFALAVDQPLDLSPLCQDTSSPGINHSARLTTAFGSIVIESE